MGFKTRRVSIDLTCFAAVEVRASLSQPPADLAHLKVPGLLQGLQTAGDDNGCTQNVVNKTPETDTTQCTVLTTFAGQAVQGRAAALDLVRDAQATMLQAAS